MVKALGIFCNSPFFISGKNYTAVLKNGIQTYIVTLTENVVYVQSKFPQNKRH